MHVYGYTYTCVYAYIHTCMYGSLRTFNVGPMAFGFARDMDSSPCQVTSVGATMPSLESKPYCSARPALQHSLPGGCRKKPVPRSSMYMYVCVYIYIHIYIYVYIHIHIHMYTDLHIHICMYANMCVGSFIWLFLALLIHRCVDTCYAWHLRGLCSRGCVSGLQVLGPCGFVVGSYHKTQ